MTCARNTLVSVEATPYYHCISRCVRRAWLWPSKFISYVPWLDAQQLAGVPENTILVPTYFVHSGPGSAPGAWQIHKNFLIHEGLSNPTDAWGTYGCIEVVGIGEWSRFLRTVKRQGGVDNHTLSNKKLVSVDIEQAVAPMATLI